MGIIESSTFKSLKFFIKDDRGEINPRLVLSERVGEEYVETVCQRGYEAHFVQIKPWQYETKEKKTVKGFEIILDDETDGEVRFTCAWTHPSRKFVNYLLGSTGEFDKLRLSVSAKDYEGKTYVSLRCNIDGQLSNLLLDREQQKDYITAIKDPDTNEIISRKYTKLHDFFESKYKELNSRVKGNSLQQIISKPEESAKTVEKAPKTVEEDDDALPF